MKAKWEMSDKYNLAGSGASLVGYADIRDLDADKTSLVIRAKNIPGALFHVLKCFNDAGINLSKIESRPIISSRAWDYYFYLDFEKGLNATATQRAMKELEKVASMIKVLGTYRRDDKVYEE